MSILAGAMRRVGPIIAVGLILASFGAIWTVSVRAQEATPTPSAENPLAELLQLAPDVMSGTEEPPVQIATYADLAAQTAVSGLPLPTSVEDENFVPWAFALIALVSPSNLFSYALLADWHSLLGFDLWEIEQSMEVGEPPMVYTLFRGRFDEAAIRAAWANQGYRMLDVDGIEVASLHEDASFDITSDLGRFTFARFNNAAILPDGTLVYSPTLDGMRLLIAVAQGTAPSLGDRPDVAVLVGAIEKPLASAMLLAGTALQGMPSLGFDVATPLAEVSDAMATQIAEFARMPPISMALLGVTPGGPLPERSNADATPQPDIPPAQLEIALLLESQEAAETAVHVAEERLATQTPMATGQPLTDNFSSWDSHVLPDQPVAVLELNFAPGVPPRIWAEMIFRRDLPFLAW
ncbi:MAG TPA: hypothetical protein VKB09_12830 [Thermomicrobiales bacterium]|nr:hypothetical protein [Thermomicrobiales bacterium]